MKRIILTVFLLCTGISFAQDMPVELFRYNSARTASAAAELSEQVTGAKILELDRQAYDRLFEERSYRISLLIPVSETEKIPVLLERFDILAPDAKIVAKGADGEKEVDLRNIVLSYKGNIPGAGNSVVSISLYNGKVVGMMKSSYDSYVLGELNDRSGNGTGEYVMYQESMLNSRRDFKCGSEQFGVPDDVLKMMQRLDEDNKDASDILRVAKVAIDVDRTQPRTLLL